MCRQAESAYWFFKKSFDSNIPHGCWGTVVMNCLNPASASGWFQKISDTSEYTYKWHWFKENECYQSTGAS